VRTGDKLDKETGRGDWARRLGEKTGRGDWARRLGEKTGREDLAPTFCDPGTGDSGGVAPRLRMRILTEKPSNSYPELGLIHLFFPVGGGRIIDAVEKERDKAIDKHLRIAFPSFLGRFHSEKLQFRIEERAR
jgi:hypothetical protein